ncbi:hypothetical protein CDAR_487371 [Caerostris darwini]|uniref:Uncharacterized protein n=1 Tax=Caerostris darwini TaxID=1538125 RepID=A0AAV4MYM7_9ARAC|nr:hypothetical protein CDAR_487371 [Caerostris darwini]
MSAKTLNNSNEQNRNEKYFVKLKTLFKYNFFLSSHIKIAETVPPSHNKAFSKVRTVILVSMTTTSKYRRCCGSRESLYGGSDIRSAQRGLWRSVRTVVLSSLCSESRSQVKVSFELWTLYRISEMALQVAPRLFSL